VYVVRGVMTPSLDADLRKSLSRMIYAIVCFAMFFSFVGTILGGIWADQSWGRFWGWDPKENGAVLIVLWNALILHARWSGMVRERGMALLAIFGNVVTSWSFFGTNMLGIGLHSYGFMDAAVPWLVSFDLLQVALIGIGLIPMRYWQSFQAASNARGFQPVMEGTARPPAKGSPAVKPT
jgi:cytochrome c biogenesis factor